ncbi:MAG: hypothetical protein LBT46_05180, partial [Planctomycetaceae bacterium]|nr:hypothetical protein [Planctomycetaceae bacterium]
MLRSRRFVFLIGIIFLALVLAIQYGNSAAAQQPDNAAQQAEQERQKKEREADAVKNVVDTVFKEGWLGPGGYFSPIKLSLYIVIFIAWVGCASWTNCDQERLKKEGRESFNLFYVAVYAGGGTLVFFIPVFWVAFVVTALMCFVPVLFYVSARNKGLPPADKVLTGEHLYYLFAVTMGKIGIKMAIQQRTAYSGGPAIELG